MNNKYWKNLSAWLLNKGLNLELNPTPTKFTNGMGNLNYKIFIDDKPFVIRRPPLGPIPPGANDMKREHHVMSSLSKNLHLVPNSILLCEDIDIFGAPFHIIDYKEGITINGDQFPKDYKSAKDAKYISSMLIEVLVQLHSIKPEEVGLENFGKPLGFLKRQLNGWHQRGIIAHDNIPSKNMNKLFEILCTFKIPEEKEFVILHNDFKLDNLILKPSINEKILIPQAIIDWDQATRGHPLFDLATLLSYWTLNEDTNDMLLLKQMPSPTAGFISRKEALNLYKKLSGRSVEDFIWIYALSLLKLGVVFQQLYAQFLRGTIKENKYKKFGTIAEAAYLRGINALNNNVTI
jgi:aminoglycoside phosphotransferase (APT) family kinase protein